MPLSEVRKALETWTSDESVIHRFLSLWPLVDSILEAFSQATQLPIFVYMNGTRLFQSSASTMPAFCGVMLGDGTTASRCLGDGWRRAAGEEADVSEGLQLCHAGMLNGRMEVDVGHLGTLFILYGSKLDGSAEATGRRERLLAELETSDPARAARLRATLPPELPPAAIAAEEKNLMTAIGDVLHQLFAVTVGFHWVAVNMAHELSNLMLGTGLLVRDFEERLSTLPPKFAGSRELKGLRTSSEPLLSESQLGLYVVRNFLSHVSETRYREVVSPRFAPLQLGPLLRQLVDLHRRLAQGKAVNVRIDDDIVLPTIHGIAEEIRRALHNVLSNAVKYSYHSIPNHPREVRIWSKVPYDPGFRETRFALCFENYGLGVTPEELRLVTRPGYRGRQAVAEVPIGSGIGLSEVKKIMGAHGGELKFRSREIHRDERVGPTYLTLVELIFPYRAQS